MQDAGVCVHSNRVRKELLIGVLPQEEEHRPTFTFLAHAQRDNERCHVVLVAAQKGGCDFLRWKDAQSAGLTDQAHQFRAGHMLVVHQAAEHVQRHHRGGRVQVVVAGEAQVHLVRKVVADRVGDKLLHQFIGAPRLVAVAERLQVGGEANLLGGVEHVVQIPLVLVGDAAQTVDAVGDDLRAHLAVHVDVHVQEQRAERKKQHQHIGHDVAREGGKAFAAGLLFHCSESPFM